MMMGGAGPGSQAQARGEAEGLVLLEFVGASAGPVNYRGMTTGATYRFGNTESARRRYVHPADVDHFLSMTGKFRRADPLTPMSAPPSPQLQAPGAPTPMVRTATPVPQQQTAPIVPRDPRYLPPTTREPQRQPVPAGIPDDQDLAAQKAAQLRREREAAAVPAGGRPGRNVATSESAPPPVVEQRGPIGGLTYMEIRTLVPDWDREQVAMTLAKEKAAEQPREAVIKLLETALPLAKEPAVSDGE